MSIQTFEWICTTDEGILLNSHCTEYAAYFDNFLQKTATFVCLR